MAGSLGSLLCPLTTYRAAAGHRITEMVKAFNIDRSVPVTKNERYLSLIVVFGKKISGIHIRFQDALQKPVNHLFCCFDGVRQRFILADTPHVSLAPRNLSQTLNIIWHCRSRLCDLQGYVIRKPTAWEEGSGRLRRAGLT